ncbi:MAG: calcium:proton antiporter [Rhizobiales bacterium]|nr:calcium:proton antiporter [Hyphomicrobiales bacterium]
MATGKSATAAGDRSSLVAFLLREKVLGVALLSCAVAFYFEHELASALANPLILIGVLAWLFIVILATAIGVVRHAEALSHRLGEPYGTLVLTLAITGIEVMSITAVMMHGENNPALVRDTLFSVVMIIMGGMVGISLLLGAFRHKELSFNLQGANAYLGVIIPLAVFSLVLPDFTRSTGEPTLTGMQKVMVGVMAVCLYAVFLLIQTGRHRAFFSLPETEDAGPHEEEGSPYPLYGSLLLLVGYIVPIILLVEQLAKPVDYIIETLDMPAAIGGVLMAILVTAPEALGGIRSALANRLQQSVNIFLGSVLATIGLTVPIMLMVSSALGLELVLGLAGVDMVLLLLIFAVSIVTFSSGRTHVLQGAVHFLIFVAFLMLLYRG